MKAIMASIMLILSVALISGCAGQNPYQRTQYAVSQNTANVYQPVQKNLPYSNTNLRFQPLQRPATVTNQTEFQKYLNSQNIPQQQYQKQQYQQQYQQQQYQQQYQQQSRNKMSDTQRCEYSAQNRLADATANYQASTMYNNDGFFSGAEARVKFRNAKTSVQKSYTSCMQNAQRKMLREQYQNQNGYARY